MALRIGIESIAIIANKYDKYVKPLLSIYSNFYIRLFLKIKKNNKKVKNSI